MCHVTVSHKHAHCARTHTLTIFLHSTLNFSIKFLNAFWWSWCTITLAVRCSGCQFNAELFMGPALSAHTVYTNGKWNTVYRFNRSILIESFRWSIFNLVLIKFELYDGGSGSGVCIVHLRITKWFNLVEFNGLCSHFQCMFLNWLVTPTRLQNLFSLLNYSIDCKLEWPQYAFGQCWKYLHFNGGVCVWMVYLISYNNVDCVAHSPQFTVSRVHILSTTDSAECRHFSSMGN